MDCSVCMFKSTIQGLLGVFYTNYYFYWLYFTTCFLVTSLPEDPTTECRKYLLLNLSAFGDFRKFENAFGSVFKIISIVNLFILSEVSLWPLWLALCGSDKEPF